MFNAHSKTIIILTYNIIFGILMLHVHVGESPLLPKEQMINSVGFLALMNRYKNELSLCVEQQRSLERSKTQLEIDSQVSGMIVFGVGSDC